MPGLDRPKTLRSAVLVLAIFLVAFLVRHSPAAVQAVRPASHFTPFLLAAIFIFCVFSIYWELASKNSKPAASSESIFSRAFHMALLNAGLLLLILPISGLTWRVLPAARIFPWLGLAIEIAGFALAVWARRALGSNWSGEVRIAADHQLVRSGPYRLIRHPIYTAMLTMSLGILLVSGQAHALLGWLLILLAYIRKIRMEEAALTSAFGDAFTAWQRDSWLLLPRVY